MRRNSWGIALISALLLCLLLSACSSKDNGTAPSREESLSVSTNDLGYDTSAATTGEQAAVDAESGGETSTAEDAAPVIPEDGRQRIRRVSLDLQTKEFDALLESLMRAITDSGGYVENSDIQNNGYYGGGNRYAYMMARIPKDQVDAFIAVVGDAALITSRQETLEDVTLAYTDTESRIEALRVEQERLMALLEEADTLDAIVALESRLTEVRYELESYTSQLRTYDNQIEYSYVSLDIQEVERLTEVSSRPTVWSRMKSGLADSLHAIARGAENFAVWLVANLPYLLMWAAGIAVVVVVVRRWRKKCRARKKETPPPAPPKEKE